MPDDPAPLSDSLFTHPPFDLLPPEARAALAPDSLRRGALADSLRRVALAAHDLDERAFARRLDALGAAPAAAAATYDALARRLADDRLAR